ARAGWPGRAVGGSCWQSRGRYRDVSGKRGVVQHQSDVCLEARAVSLLMEIGQEVRRHVLAGDASRMCCRETCGEHSIMEGRIELLLRAQRIHHDQSLAHR